MGGGVAEVIWLVGELLLGMAGLGVGFGERTEPFRDAVALQKRPGASAGGVAGYGGEFGGGVHVQRQSGPSDDAGL